MIINLIFFVCSIPHLKISLLNNSPTFAKVRKDIIKELKRIKHLNNIIIPSNPYKRKGSRKDFVQTPDKKTNISKKKDFKNSQSI